MTRAVASLALASVALFMAFVLAASAWELRIQQRLIEDENRVAIGLWLKTQAKEGDRVFLEPIGYIGYFSEARILDWLGLVSPEVIQLRRRGLEYPEMIPVLNAEWVVLRPLDIISMVRIEAATGYDFTSHYDLVRVFDRRNELAHCPPMPGWDWVNWGAKPSEEQGQARAAIPGWDWVNWDAAFYVFKRKSLAH